MAARKIEFTNLKSVGAIVAVMMTLSFATSSSDVEKKCFEDGNASFAQKTNDVYVVYGDKKSPKLSFVKYNVKNNPLVKDGYPEKSFYMINLPKEVLKTFAVNGWNEYLCGSILPFAYPNVNEFTTIVMKKGSSSITQDEKNIMFAAMKKNSKELTTPETVLSFSKTIPGNVYYPSFPIGKVYPNDFIDNFNKNIFTENKAIANFVDQFVNLFKIKDFEERKVFIKKLREDGFDYINEINTLNKGIDDFIDLNESENNNDAYNEVQSHLKVMNDKFRQVQPYMTANSAAFAEAVQQFYLEFEKESKRYLKKMEKKKDKETKRKLDDYSKQTLKDAIGMILRGIERLGHSGDVSDRKIGFLLNDYEVEFKKVLNDLESGNFGPAKIANPSISMFLNNMTFLVDLMGLKRMLAKNEEADNDGANSIELDDGTTVILFGKRDEKEDGRLLVRSETSKISMLYLNKNLDGIKGGHIDGVGLVDSRYLPPIQVIFSGETNNLNLYGGKASLLNESIFPTNFSYSSSKAIALQEKLKCVFDAAKGNMREFKKYVSNREIDINAVLSAKAPKNFKSLSCSDGVVSYPKEDEPVVSPNAKNKIKKIPNQTIIAGKYSTIRNLNRFVESANCKVHEIEWSVGRSKHLSGMVSMTNDVTVHAENGWCGQETITFIADFPNGETIRTPVVYTIECSSR